MCAATLCLLGVPTSGQQNVLLIIADDVGTDLIGAYGDHPVPGKTPVIDALAADGILFRNAWSHPVCSPTRAAMLTGRHAFRTGIGYAVQYGVASMELYPEEVTIADVLSPTYTTAALGKWHLSAKALSDVDHPQLLGFDEYRGNLAVLPTSLPGLLGDGYYNFNKVVNGSTSVSTTYNTTDIVDDALDLISSYDKPWFIWMAFNAPHTPYHKPPGHLHTYDLPDDITTSWAEHGRAMLEALDTELGRLFASMDPVVLSNTLIIFLGDNGTSEFIVTPPADPNKAKETVYEGGVNVPLIIVGPGVVAGEECEALVNLTDIFATIAEIGGFSASSGVDSVSLVPYFSDPDVPSLREWIYTELTRVITPGGEFNSFGPFDIWDRAVSDGHYKLMWEYDGGWSPNTVRLFDLGADPTESVNLLDLPLGPIAQAKFDKLTEIMVDVIPTWLDAGHGHVGSQGVPVLGGEGDLFPGTAMQIDLTSARAGAATFLMVGLSSITLPLAGGVIVPKPDLVIGGFVTNELGALTLSAQWPSGIPADFRLYLQHWIDDPVASNGFAASNALIATAH